MKLPLIVICLCVVQRVVAPWHGACHPCGRRRQCLRDRQWGA